VKAKWLFMEAFVDVLSRFVVESVIDLRLTLAVGE
jgi:hypothetical protein